MRDRRSAGGVIRPWRKVHAEAALTIHASPERLVARYLDFAHWARLFPATIRGAHLVKRREDGVVVEVDHRTAGCVTNILRPRLPNLVELEEHKPKYDALFLNRFDPVAAGTRYTVAADVWLRMPYALLVPLLRRLLEGYVRRTMRRYVLEPMRASVERSTR